MKTTNEYNWTNYFWTVKLTHFFNKKLGPTLKSRGDNFWNIGRGGWENFFQLSLNGPSALRRRYKGWVHSVPNISYIIPEGVRLPSSVFRPSVGHEFYISLALPISPEIMDGFLCSRCLNDRIEVPDMMGLFAGGATTPLVLKIWSKQP